MMFSLYSGDFFPNLEEQFLNIISGSVPSQELPKQTLVIVPAGVVRKRLLTILAARYPDTLPSIRLLSINQWAIQIVLETSRKPRRLISDPLFFPLALYHLARTKGIPRFSNFRSCLAVYQTLRDLSDGGVSSEIFQQLREEAGDNPDLDLLMKSSDAASLSQIYSEFETFCKQHRLVHLQMPSSSAIESVDDWMTIKDPPRLVIYGFYDATELQFEMMEASIRFMHRRNRNSSFFFPFRIAWNNEVEYPGAFAQPFYDRLYSLTTALVGKMENDSRAQKLASGGVESAIFLTLGDPEKQVIRDASNIEVFHAGGIYDEVWGIAKRILQLVREGISFDQIMVVTRSLDNYLVPLTHIFEENRIPCNLTRDNTLASVPFARFAYSVLFARMARLSNSTLFEILSSPFLKQPSFRDFNNLQAILTGLMIRNWDDWERINPLLEDTELPLIFDFIKPEQLDSFRNTVRYLWDLKSRLDNIPETASLTNFARSLRETLDRISKFFATEEVEPVNQLLDQISDYAMLAEENIDLSQFTEMLKFYLQRTSYHAEQTDATAQVTVGDIMQLRGITTDYVFLAGLNKDVFPRQINEDPFLPDRARERLREIAGAGPAPKRPAKRLLPVKESASEELLLFSLALRAANRKLFLSYLRADELGRKNTASAYLDGVMQLLTGNTCEGNEQIAPVPKHYKSKFIDFTADETLRMDVLPTPEEAATLTNHFSISEIAANSFQVGRAYLDHVRSFTKKLNALSIDGALEIDGFVSGDTLRSALLKENEHVRISYSQFKNYLECPFKFLSAGILGLTESPKDSEEESHDISQLMKGLISEDVVKRALRLMRDRKYSKDRAILDAINQVRSKYSLIFTPLLLNYYLQIFHRGTCNLIDYLEENDFDFSKTEVPDRGEGGETMLVRSDEKKMAIMIRGIPDFIFHRRTDDGLVVDLKWRTRAVTETLRTIFNRGEAQFCIYPEIVRARNGTLFPFAYFRLDAFASYGSPSKIETRLRDMAGVDDPKVVRRIFGASVSAEDAQLYFGSEIKQKAMEILDGKFRIIEDPNSGFSVCRYCTFTQICRRTHTPTLLRSKQVN